ncbi:hypothetical protein IWQ62_002338 [Dispira parvispora]|uniref:Uncharacterized protein n=1 Tax=Dispira parvispora TaxID=1520584 RepID=A0A9W8E7K4_9FUNG|nr:hypothetical protein IWQ62_002338 [Dispira parvispora]
MSTFKVTQQTYILETSFTDKNPQEGKSIRDAMQSTANWNGMLLNARRKRGACYDPATGMYQFPRNSDQYYSITDPSRWRPRLP